MRGRYPILLGCVLGIVGVGLTAVALGRWFPDATVPLPGFVPLKLRESALVDKALLAAIIGPGVGALSAGYAVAEGPLRGAGFGYLVSLVSIWLVGIVLPGGFFLVAGVSALIALRPTLVAVYFASLLGVLGGGLVLSSVLALPGGLWGALGATVREAWAGTGSSRPDRP